MNRRDFLKLTPAAAAAVGGIAAPGGAAAAPAKTIRIRSTASNFERNPLIRPFGFKGGYMTEIWQSVARLESESGAHATAIGTQSVLWSDASVFASHSESGGNALMYAMTERALQLAKGCSFTRPDELLDQLYPEVLAYGRRITARDALRPTFALNALVAVDNAAWMLYAKENGLRTFDALIPPEFRAALPARHARVAAIPLMAYAIPIDEIRAAVEQGYFFMKIKIGQPGTQQEMLDKDMARLSAIHAAIGDARTPHTKDGRLPYYFDANGRYEAKDTFLRLLDHARKIGAFDQIAVIEEPFDEEADIDVHDIPVRLAADETAHTDAHAIERIEMGYRSIAVKAIAKTLSMTFRVARAAHERNVPCFCADLTVHPILIDWNKNVAARLAPFPGLGLGLLESNGHQNYRQWAEMVGHHPRGDASWTQVHGGVFELGDDFYDGAGGILDPSPHFEAMVSPPGAGR
jgi:L-alanine-DL-glutamate epimerase-like enolase superfamily enzyme